VARVRLTDASCQRYTAPAGKREQYFDALTPGLVLRVSGKTSARPAGSKSWSLIFRLRGVQSRMTLGTYPAIGLAEARRKAQDALRLVAEGKAPRPAKVTLAPAAEARTLAAAIDRYLTERPADKSRRTLRAEYLIETGRTLTRDVKPILGDRPLAALTGDDIKRLVRGIAKDRPSQANHVLAYLSAMLGWAVDEGLIEKSPAVGVKMPAQKVERDRALDDDEIRLFWRACDDVGWPFGPLAQLLLLTGQRRDELAHATWREFDPGNQTWTLPAERAKNGRAHIVHLPRLALEILGTLQRHASKRGWVFATGLSGADTPISGFGRGRERISAAMAARAGSPIDHFTLHDLRRSAATGMAALGVAPHVVDKILNHSAGRISGVAKIYNRFEYLPERLAALDRWAEHIEALIGKAPASSNVVPMVKMG
jgi:integrase